MQTATIEIITGLDSMIRSRNFDGYIGDKLGNDLFINDPERAERLEEYAESGADGSTHQEHIEDWKDANSVFLADGIYKSQFVSLGFSADTAEMLADALRDAIDTEIADVEEWHDKNGSLFNVVG